MSLTLIQGYSSAEEEETEDHQNLSEEDEQEEEDELFSTVHSSVSYKEPTNGSSSVLPSAVDAFSQISGPPQFLNNSVEEYGMSARDVEQQGKRHGGRSRTQRKDKNDMPTGAVVEAKAQLVGIHERVRSDIEGQQPPSSLPTTTQNGGKHMPTATNPSAEDASELLRMCLQCGIPKTYSSQRGMVCPQCTDRLPADTGIEPKKKGSTIKDKEKSKRMKGQSSHATWKSETEMQLRQQFD